MAFGGNPFEHPREGCMKLAAMNGATAHTHKRNEGRATMNECLRKHRIQSSASYDFHLCKVAWLASFELGTWSSLALLRCPLPGASMDEVASAEQETMVVVQRGYDVVRHRRLHLCRCQVVGLREVRRRVVGHRQHLSRDNLHEVAVLDEHKKRHDRTVLTMSVGASNTFPQEPPAFRLSSRTMSFTKLSAVT